VFFQLFLRAESIVASWAATLGAEKRLFVPVDVVVSMGAVEKTFMEIRTSVARALMPKSTIILLQLVFCGKVENFRGSKPFQNCPVFGDDLSKLPKSIKLFLICPGFPRRAHKEL